MTKRAATRKVARGAAERVEETLRVQQERREARAISGVLGDMERASEQAVSDVLPGLLPSAQRKLLGMGDPLPGLLPLRVE